MGKLSGFFGLLAVCLLGFAGYRYLVDSHRPAESTTPTSDGPALVVRNPEQDFGQLPGGAEVPVRFLVANVSSRPVRVLGVAPRCGLNACVYPKRMDPFVLPAGEEVEVEYTVSPAGRGDFRVAPYLLYEGNGFQDLVMSVTGTWLASAPETSATAGASHAAAAAR